VDEIVESLQESGLLVDERPVTAAEGAQAFRRLDAVLHLALGFDNGVATHARCVSDSALPSVSEHL
jgi:hypothetical protein